MRPITGNIFRRGKAGVFYVRFKKDGKGHLVRLLNPDGQPVNSEAEAKAAADRLFAVYRETDKAEAMRRVKHDIEDAENAALEASIMQANDQAVASNIWSLYISCNGRLNSCRNATNDRPDTRSTAYLYWHICDTFGQFLIKKGIRRLADVTVPIAEKYLAQWKSSNTHGKHLTFLKHLYTTLLREGKLIGTNPFDLIQPLPKESHSRKPLSRDLVMKLIDTADGDIKGLIIVGYYTGLRLGDCCTLNWLDIHLERYVIERVPNKTRSRSRAVVKVGIPEPLRQLLSMVDEDKRKGPLFPRLNELCMTNRDYIIDKELASLFDRCGIPRHQEGTGYSRHWDKKTQKQISDKKPRAVTDYSFHSLRYSYISHNAEAGTPQAVIQRNAGHSNPAMTEHYIAISDEAAVQFANAFADADGAIFRNRLRQLAMTLPLDIIKRFLSSLDDSLLTDI